MCIGNIDVLLTSCNIDNKHIFFKQSEDHVISVDMCIHADLHVSYVRWPEVCVRCVTYKTTHNYKVDEKQLLYVFLWPVNVVISTVIVCTTEIVTVII